MTLWIKRNWMPLFFIIAISILIIAIFIWKGFDQGINSMVAFGTIGAVLVALFGDWFKTYCIPPILTLDLIPPSLTPLKQCNPLTQQLEEKGLAWYFGIKVSNGRRWRQATNCRVVLKAVHRHTSDGKLKPEPMSVPLQFQWAVPQFNPVLANISSEGQVFDFGCLIKDKDAFEPVLYVCTLNFRPSAKANEIVYYSVKILADDLIHERCDVFEVIWDGEWSNEVEEMKKHLRIRQVSVEELNPFEVK